MKTQITLAIRPFYFWLTVFVVTMIFVARSSLQAQQAVDEAPSHVTPGSTVSTTSTPTASTAVAPEAVSSTYQLAPYDIIEVTVYQEEDLHKVVKLGGDGTALLPLIGSVLLAGKTVTEAIKTVQDRYANGFLRNPNVLISVLAYRKKTFSILGQVTKPGVFEIEEGQHLNIVEAILIGGGYTRIAAQNNVTVKRVVNGKQVILHVHAADMARDADAVPFEVLPGDIIYVNESWF